MKFKYYPNYLWKSAGDRHHKRRLIRMAAAKRQFEGAI